MRLRKNVGIPIHISIQFSGRLNMVLYIHNWVTMYPRVGRNRRKTTDWDEILDICFVYFPIVTNDVFLNIVTRNHLNMNVHVKGIRIKGEVR